MKSGMIDLVNEAGISRGDRILPIWKHGTARGQLDCEGGESLKELLRSPFLPLQAKFQALECLSNEAGSIASSSDVFGNLVSASSSHTGSSSPLGSNHSSRWPPAHKPT